LFYILHRANATIYADHAAATFKLFVMDEPMVREERRHQGHLTEALTPGASSTRLWCSRRSPAMIWSTPNCFVWWSRAARQSSLGESRM
jgi:hypothetical protein